MTKAINTIQYKPFDALNVPLRDSNLIEASAGTGKTYSIAILVLRLLLEKKLQINQVLMVTFTKAAVAELNERIRLFVKLAQQYANGIPINDKTIMKIVDRCSSTNKNDLKTKIDEAAILLDETAIMTIHSFCQQTLTEFAFETNQQFGAEMFPDVADIIQQEVNNFWRRHVTTLAPEILTILDYSTLRQSIFDIVKNHLDGKWYNNYDDQIQYDLKNLDIDLFNKQLAEIRLTAKEYEHLAQKAFYEAQEDIFEILKSARSSKYQKALLEVLDEASTFFTVFEEAKSFHDKMPEPFSTAYWEANQYLKIADQSLVANFKTNLFYFAIQEVQKAVVRFMTNNNFLSYNDLIGNLHKSLTQKENPQLVAALQNKYKAVFVDEFQDTDKEQYEIFSKAFGSNTDLFFIGDPKQSIYAWRKADMATYFKARNDAANVYDMNINYRSTAGMIEGMNLFFKPQPDFDTFYFQNSRNTIDYVAVNSPTNNSKKGLTKNNLVTPSITIIKNKKKEEISYGVAFEIANLLTDASFKISENDDTRSIKPSDIGILVRKNADAEGIKNYLNNLGIPAVTVQDERILSTGEAVEVLYLLEAIQNPSTNNINRALLSSLTGYSVQEITKLNTELIAECFLGYKNTWLQNGIYPTLLQFVNEFNLLHQKDRINERNLANFYQIVELLEQVRQYKELSPDELLSWFKRGINGEIQNGDDYITRMESDHDAVKIITIHKSKGLEYNIVFAPFLDMNVSSKPDWVTFQNPETKKYHFKETAMLSRDEFEWYAVQQEQENRRLIYVAITRAVYKCYVYNNVASIFKNSGLSNFVNALENAPHNGSIEILNGPISYNSLERYQNQEGTFYYKELKATYFALLQEDWQRLSYSKISEHGVPLLRERTAMLKDDYDQFIFNRIKAGTSSGNMLHYLLEHVDFANEKSWDKIIATTLHNYLPNADDQFQRGFKNLLEHLMYTQIEVDQESFQLSDIAFNKRIAELEFDFTINNLVTENLSIPLKNEIQVATKENNNKQIEGLMNGKIDLFFEHNGKYYILDWKSNYLGYKPAENYNQQSLQEAMNNNNYHLQYLIYTVALKKYLESRLDTFDYEKQFGGVIYLFLRGVRKGESWGVFTTKPAIDKIADLEKIMNK